MQMIGFLEATRGEAFISGMDIKEDMNSIYKVMGVCPQHDLLWDALTAEEHLYFYARLKGLTGSAIREAVDVALQSVRLYDVRKKRSGQYSGGVLPGDRRTTCVRVGIVWATMRGDGSSVTPAEHSGVLAMSKLAADVETAECQVSRWSVRRTGGHMGHGEITADVSGVLIRMHGMQA